MKKILMILVLSLTMSANISAKVNYKNPVATTEINPRCGKYNQDEQLPYGWYLNCDESKNYWITVSKSYLRKVTNIYFKLENDSVVTLNLSKKTGSCEYYVTGLGGNGIGCGNLKNVNFYWHFDINQDVIDILNAHIIKKVRIEYIALNKEIKVEDYNTNFEFKTYYYIVEDNYNKNTNSKNIPEF